MVSKTSAAQWLADHVGADWLHVVLKPNDMVGANFLITLRFSNDYCQSSMKLRCDYSSHAELHRTIIENISQMRDEFFLFKMHALSSEEGMKLETRLRK